MVSERIRADRSFNPSTNGIICSLACFCAICSIEDVIKSKTANVVMLLIGITTVPVQNDCILSIILLVLPMSDVVQEAANEEAGEKGEY